MGILMYSLHWFLLLMILIFLKKMFIPLESHGENSEAWNRNKILSLFRRTGNEQFTLESSL